MPTDPFRPIEPEPAATGFVDTDALLDDLEQEEAVREALAGSGDRALGVGDTRGSV